MALKIRKALYGAVSQEVVDVLLKLGGLCVTEEMHDEAQTILFECLTLESELYASVTADTEPDIDTHDGTAVNTSEMIVFKVKDNDASTASTASTVQFHLKDCQPTVVETVNIIACNFKAKTQ
jgi:hypothetical protein